MAEVRLRDYDNSWYDPGRSVAVRVLWILVCGAFFQTWFPWPSSFKRALLRLFGGKIGARVVIKPRVTIKYPWNLEVGDDCWIGEHAWLDSLAKISLGHDAVLSQDCFIETGNHDWSKPTFDLVLKPVVIEAGAWAAARSTLLPGARLASHAVLGAGSVLSGDTEPFGIYSGIPAKKISTRQLSE
ncbi:MAG: WcaF family extracellular polysaccharide biosynthesis acetyltransferase [Myxococcaceae bacterium]